MILNHSNRDLARAHALDAGSRYFMDGVHAVEALPLAQCGADPTMRLTTVALPDWASDIGAGEKPGLLVDSCCVIPGQGPAYERCDWLLAAFLHLEGWLERSVEERAGPIHSYALRLPPAWSAAYDHAWVNRIFLFLRRWAARTVGADEASVFGPRPEARFVLTHDVDALEKTLPLRLKSTVMSGVAAVRHLAGGRMREAMRRIGASIPFAVTSSDYCLFDRVCRSEVQRGFRSVFLFANRRSTAGAVTWLMDPGYRVDDARLTGLIRQLLSGGWQVGAHPGFKTWNDSARLGEVVSAVAAAAARPISLCRQHWLRFSWADTWKAQSAAGIKMDFTLAFNDRPGLRNGAALRYRPWDHDAGAPARLEIVPTLLMDSHFYDYAFPPDPAAAMARWVDEVIAVGGEAALLWHVHTMHEEYGWGRGYEALLDLLEARGARVTGADLE